MSWLRFTEIWVNMTINFDIENVHPVIIFKETIFISNKIAFVFPDPLVNVSLKPDSHVKVTISAHQETEVREELIPVHQTVAQFKAQLNQWFHIPIQNMKLYYCDQVSYTCIKT